MNPLHYFLVSSIKLLPKPLVKPFAMRYVAGDKLDDALRVVGMLNENGMMASLDILGENVTTRDNAAEATRDSEDVLQAIDDHHLNANLSLKLTQIGFKIDEEFCYSNLKSIVEAAGHHANFVRIDMEDSTTTTATLKLYERLRSEGIQNAGIVIQARLRRSEDDLKQLIPMEANVRLCKGAYIEPESIAFKSDEEIRLNYLRLLRILIEAGCYVGIATHDESLVKDAVRTIQENHLEKASYEFQMLHGVKGTLRNKILGEGHRLRVYVPFGKDWYAYSMRRFKENPQLAWEVLGSMFSRA